MDWDWVLNLVTSNKLATTQAVLALGGLLLPEKVARSYGLTAGKIVSVFLRRRTGSEHAETYLQKRLNAFVGGFNEGADADD